ncbi:hypothetical protein [Domibacillus indicus]|nr:hypothetical protein [Domibacillus indicus]
MKDWERFIEGATKGFEEFIKVVEGNKDIKEAMEDINDHFERRE